MLERDEGINIHDLVARHIYGDHVGYVLRHDLDDLGEDVGAPQRGKKCLAGKRFVEAVEVKGRGGHVETVGHPELDLLNEAV